LLWIPGAAVSDCVAAFPLGHLWRQHRVGNDRSNCFHARSWFGESARRTALTQHAHTAVASLWIDGTGHCRIRPGFASDLPLGGAHERWSLTLRYRYSGIFSSTDSHVADGQHSALTCRPSSAAN